MQKDTKVQSLIRGRIGAAVMAAVAFLGIAFGLGPDEQQTAATLADNLVQWVAGGAALLSGIGAAFSKFREGKK